MSAAARSKAPIGVALGDPNGVGPEIAVKAALALHASHGIRALLVGDGYIVEHCCDVLKLSQGARASFDVHDTRTLPQGEWAPGEVRASAGAATVQYVRAALELQRSGRIAAIGAAPHSETAVNAAGIAFSGYSGLLADLTGTPRDQVFLMLEAQGLRVIHVTLHERVVDAIGRMTPALVEAAARAAQDTLRLLGVAAPRLCVLGINPHAGEGGLFGDDDERITRPAVTAMRHRGWEVDGPVGADLALAERKHDAYVAMLHDQGHIAVKMLSPKGATAIVAGLPLLFASVGHGAAFDIAGQGKADACAMTATLTMLAEAAA
jgi:4-hydroxy-L-threonine phosphate dehydrogenase PdxA